MENTQAPFISALLCGMVFFTTGGICARGDCKAYIQGLNVKLWLNEHKIKCNAKSLHLSDPWNYYVFYLKPQKGINSPSCIDDYKIIHRPLAEFMQWSYPVDEGPAFWVVFIPNIGFCSPGGEVLKWEIETKKPSPNSELVNVTLQEGNSTLPLRQLYLTNPLFDPNQEVIKQILWIMTNFKSLGCYIAAQNPK